MPQWSVDRRRVLAAAALGRNLQDPGPVSDEGELLRAVSGEILDVSPHLIIIGTPDGREERLVIAPWATAWRGDTVAPADLPMGAQVVVRTLQAGRVAERIWADTVRVTGVIEKIRGRSGDRTMELYCGPHRGHRTVVIPYAASGRLQVRHPKLEPGYLFDAIGVREDGVARARLPATSQPPYRWTAVPEPPPAYGGAQEQISATVTWSDAFDPDERGAAYPMLESADSGCDEAGVSCTGLPYLALGSTLEVRNVCAERTSIVPIVTCGCLAGRFCDRCLECGTSPRGRIAELSPSSFVELGGDLTKGCFNARVGLG
ncbi:hypothetical protein [Planomonospora venezuelensis]|uniref:Uncharacterized protein n=1 Tax=Planomonospora venezuelensis TaxID=1999 RepID=A0A841CU99_PLAVE|nr:hypothetical protein [Planomonospora venezuelensis]MBB5960910.1 hypothetical protein [Planomonospora venezuelensis]GIN01146.1 hypothetical protein Pve01_28040 [Planomonospora venezuelensis]